MIEIRKKQMESDTSSIQQDLKQLTSQYNTQLQKSLLSGR